MSVSPSLGYTVRETLDNGRAYDCTMCPRSSPDLDLARAHYAIHVAGPDTLMALQVFISEFRSSGNWKYVERVALDAIARAEPKGA